MERTNLGPAAVFPPHPVSAAALRHKKYTLGGGGRDGLVGSWAARRRRRRPSPLHSYTFAQSQPCTAGGEGAARTHYRK